MTAVYQDTMDTSEYNLTQLTNLAVTQCIKSLCFTAIASAGGASTENTVRPQRNTPQYAVQSERTLNRDDE